MIKLVDDNSIQWDEIKRKHLEMFKADCQNGLAALRCNTEQEKLFKEFLIKIVDNNSLLIGLPNELRAIRLCYLKLKKDGLNFKRSKVALVVNKRTRKVVEKETLVYTAFYKKLYKIFNYDKFRRSYLETSNWGAYHFIKELAVKSCLYCNRNYTVTYDRAFETRRPGSGKVRPVLDHLFLRSTYPFFGISLFNLIPACYECNSGLKGSKIKFKNEDHLNPYSESMHALYEFSDEIKLATDGGIEWDKFDETSFSLTCKPRTGSDEDLLKRADINKDVFAIEELYNCHLEIALPILFHVNNYGFGRIDDLAEKVDKLPYTLNDWKRLVFGNVINDITMIKRVPFSKLTLDIAQKYKIVSVPE